MASERDILTAIIAAINGTLSTSVRAYETSEVPDPRPSEFASVSLVRVPGGMARGGRRSTKGWDVYVMAASSSAANNARTTLHRASAALEGKCLTVGDESSTPAEYRSGRAVAPDDGWQTGVVQFRFAI